MLTYVFATLVKKLKVEVFIKTCSFIVLKIAKIYF